MFYFGIFNRTCYLISVLFIMKIKLIILTAVIGLVLFYGTNLAFAQDFSSVLKKLEEIDTRLNRLSDDLEQTRTIANQKGEAEIVSTLAMDLCEVADEIRTKIEESPGTNMEVTTESQTSDELLPIEITGFGDFCRMMHCSKESYGIGQVEIDLEKNLTENITFIAAVAYDNEEETFGLGEFNVCFHFFGSDGEHFHPVSGIDHSGIKVGQLDVPFGIDWQVYPSIDRKLVSVPLVVENTHEEWNDYGVQIYMDIGQFDAVVFGLNGFGYDDVEMKLAIGGRLGITPNKFIEIGGSYAGFLNGNSKTDMSLTGVDLQFHYQAFSFKGEYIAHRLSLAGDNTVNNSGFYCQGMYDLGRYYIVTRYGMFSPDVPETDDITRFSSCLGWIVLEGCELRFEYQVNSEEDNASFMQMAIGF